jgi:hypothetical protein
VAMNTVDADTQNLGVCGLEARQKSLDARHFLASGGCPVEWVEEEQDVPPIAEILERDLSTELVVQAEPRCRGSFGNHGRMLLSRSGSLMGERYTPTEPLTKVAKSNRLGIHRRVRAPGKEISQPE